MSTHFSLATNRLLIEPLTLGDDHFIFELLNTESWLRYIGNRNITSVEKATEYIQNILAKENTTYWVVELKKGKTKLGIVTFIQRDYLPHPDVGFAFLPQSCKQGFAYEAANAVLQQLFQQGNHTHILATTLPYNLNSIRLLEKIGFVFEKEMELEKETLLVYKVSIDKLSKVPMHNSI